MGAVKVTEKSARPTRSPCLRTKIVASSTMTTLSFSLNKKPAPARRQVVSTASGFDDDNLAPQSDIQSVSTFDRDAGGAIQGTQPAKPRAPLVIPPPQTGDWRDRARKKNVLPAEEQARRAGAEPQAGGSTNGPEEGEPTYGLVLAKKRRLSPNGDAKATTVTAVAETKTADEEAIEAFMSDGNKKSTLVIPATAQDTEEEDLRHELATLPDSATVEDYAAVPIEDFGAAILRGQGLREGGAIGRRRNQDSNGSATVDKRQTAKLLERRPAFLGIGAKKEKDVPELGAWGKGLAKKITEGAAPMVLRNKRTGEIRVEGEAENENEREGESRRHRDDDRRTRDKRDSGRDHRERDRDHRERDRDRRDRHRDHDERDRDPREHSSRDYDRRREDRRDRDRDRGRDGKYDDRDRSRRDYDGQRHR